MARYLTKRGGFWRFCRRVPDEYAALDRRGIVQQSTKVRIVDDPRGIRAREVALRMNDALEKYWPDLANAGTAQAVADYNAASKVAKRMNISPPDASAQAPSPSCWHGSSSLSVASEWKIGRAFSPSMIWWLSPS
jgi:hypothetical protein